jgi:IPT/TIG domain
MTMALQQFDLNRAGETPVATLKLNEITPKDWRRYPPPVEDMTPEHVPVITYHGGVPLDEAEASPYETGTANSTDDYTPRTQQDKATALGVPFAKDIGRRRGAIDPRQPYPVATDPAPAAPTLASVTPNTAEVGSGPLVVTLTGTNFTAWSTVETGGYQTTYFRYKSPTEIEVMIDTDRAAPGGTDIAVWDHGVASAPVTFTFTAAV